ncbi:MAG: hypothetical protein ACD_79C00920G0001 [uncultured bacterium]|nr:MAG: hypothetical protein ACD_79C00920G0001 [uncultured bacterium]
MTDATPGTFSSLSLSLSFAILSISKRGMVLGSSGLPFDTIEYIITGLLNGLNFKTKGSSASLGSLSLTRSIFSLRFRDAKFISVPQSNSAITIETPSLENDLIVFSFFTVAIDSSISLVTRVSISSGAALEYGVTMVN